MKHIELPNGWRDFCRLWKAEIAMLRQYRRERAIERIKAQPFFNPRLPHPFEGLQWSAAEIAEMYDAIRDSLVYGFGVISVDMAKPGGDKSVTYAKAQTMSDVVDLIAGMRKFNQPCHACGGVGYIIPDSPVMFRHSRVCDGCDGTGGRPR